tara:strand:+ start:15798 stop:16262 length:465 start_codon:yes stop_codon:yes gene_type:complete
MYNRNLNDLLREFMNEDLFSSSFTEFRLPKLRYNNDVNKREYSENTPSTNVYEDEWSYRYELATPGFTKKDLTITLKESNLEIKGERKIENKKEKGEYISKEYHTTKFFRSFNLPENVVLDEVHAKVENGITILFLPKVTKTKVNKGTRTIEIS